MHPGQQIAKQSSTQHGNTMPVVNHNADGEDSSIHGEFDAEEPESVLESVKASKGTRPIVSTSTGNLGLARYI